MYRLASYFRPYAAVANAAAAAAAGGGSGGRLTQPDCILMVTDGLAVRHDSDTSSLASR
jgi:hypothetical protein